MESDSSKENQKLPLAKLIWNFFENQVKRVRCGFGQPGNMYAYLSIYTFFLKKNIRFYDVKSEKKYETDLT